VLTVHTTYELMCQSLLISSTTNWWWCIAIIKRLCILSITCLL